MRIDKYIRYYIVFGLLGIFFIAVVFGANTKRLNIEEAIKKPPRVVPIKNYIWIEAEKAISQNFCPEPIWNYFCSGKYALQLASETTPPKSGYYAVYEFYVKEAGVYELWMGITPPGSIKPNGNGYASPFYWQIDDGPIFEAGAENTIATEYYGIGGYHWTYIAKGFLDTGRHTLKIIVKKKRPSGWDYYFYIDAILFVPVLGKDIVLDIKKEKVFPKSFSLKKKIDYQKSLDYLKAKAKSLKREDVLNLVKAYIALYDYPKAIEILKKYLARRQADTFMRLHLAFSYLWYGKEQQAMKEFERIVSVNPKYIDVYKIMGTILAWSGNYERAIKEYKKVIYYNKKDVSAYLWISNVLLWKGKIKESKKYFKKAEEIASENIEAMYKIAELYEWTDDSRSAIKVYEKIISINPYEIDAYKRIARIYLIEGKKDEAMKYIEQARIISENSPEFSNVSLNVLEDVRKEREENIREYKEQIRKNPYDVSKYKILTSLFLAEKEFKEAIRYYDIYKALNMAIWGKEIDRDVSKIIIPYMKVWYLQRKFLELYPDLVKLLDEKDPKLRQRFLKLYAQEKEILKELVNVVKNDGKKYKKDLENYKKKLLGLSVRYGGLNEGWRMPFEVLEEYKEILSQNQPLKIYGDYFYYLMLSYLKGVENIVGMQKVCRSKEEFCKYSFGEFWSLLYGKRYDGISPDLQDAYTRFWNWKTSLDRRISNANPIDVKVIPDKLKRDFTVDKKRVLEAYNLWFDFLKEVVHLALQYGELRSERFKLMVISTILQEGYVGKATKEIEFVNSIKPDDELGNFILANVYRWNGRWKDSARVYLRILKKNPTSKEAKEYIAELRDRYSPKVEDSFKYLSEPISQRIENELYFVYPLTNYFSAMVGTTFLSISDSTGSVYKEQDFYESSGSATAIGGLVGISYLFAPLYTTFSARIDFRSYKGKIDYEGDVLDDANISYTSFNYKFSAFFESFIFPFTVLVEYGKKDVNQLTQALRQENHQEITANFVRIVLNVNFSFLKLPILERFLLFSTYEIGKYSDGNALTTSYNQLSYKLLEFVNKGIEILVGGIFSYENAKFQKYSSEEIVNLPYYAPSSLVSYGAFLQWNQERTNFSYNIGISYTKTSRDEKGITPYGELFYDFGRFYIKINASYYLAMYKPENPDEEPYSAISVGFKAGTRIYNLFLKP